MYISDELRGVLMALWIPAFAGMTMVANITLEGEVRPAGVIPAKAHCVILRKTGIHDDDKHF